MYMLNYRFEVLHFNAEVGQFFNTALDQIDSEKVVVIPDFDRPISLSDDFIFNNVDPIEQPLLVPSYTYGDLTLIYDPSKPCFAIRNNEKKYMSFSENKYSFSRDEYKMWEYFWTFDEGLIERLKYVQSNSWISKRTSMTYGPSEISIGEDFNIFIGRFALDIRFQNLNDFGQYEMLGIVDNWAPETFLLYNPAVYITAYSSNEVFRQLRLCVRSLRDIGNYDGKVIVMTEKDKEYINKVCEEKDGSIEVDNLYPSDFVGFVCSKYSVFDKKIFDGYQPILYLDPDVIIDSEIRPMLTEAVTTQQICMPLEQWHPMKTNPSVGATLLQLDALDPGPFAAGSNGGTIAIPNTKDINHRRVLELVSRTLTHIGLKYGRRWSIWADQEALNYVAYKFGGFNTSVLTKYAGFVDAPKDNKRGRLGFLHFFGHSSSVKTVKMRDYLAELYRAEGVARELPADPC